MVLRQIWAWRWFDSIAISGAGFDEVCQGTEGFDARPAMLMPILDLHQLHPCHIQLNLYNYIKRITKGMNYI